MAFRSWERTSFAPPPTLLSPVPEVKFISLDFKQADADGSFEGYASLFGREDLGRDIVLPGAFRESLASRGRAASSCSFSMTPTSPSVSGRRSRKTVAGSTHKAA